MSNYMTIVRGLMLSVTLASIFAILVVMILAILRQAAFFSRRSQALVAVSISILFLVAFSYFLVGSGDTYRTAGHENEVRAAGHSLLPGVALGIAAAVVLSQVMLLASQTSPEEKPQLLAKKPESPAVKAKSPGRPKKAEPEQQRVPQKSAGKGKGEAKAVATTEGATTI